MKNLITGLSLFFTNFLTFSQWQPIPINLARIYLNSVDSETILVKVNEFDLYQISKGKNSWNLVNTEFIKKPKGVGQFSQKSNYILLSEFAQGGNIYLSSNYGENFAEIKDINPSHNIQGLFMNNVNLNMYINTFPGPRLLKSKDKGKTWVVDTTGIQFIQSYQTRRIFMFDTMEVNFAGSNTYTRVNQDGPWKRWFGSFEVNKSSQNYSCVNHNGNFMVATNIGIYKFVPKDSSWARYDQNNSQRIIGGGMVSLGRFFLFANQNDGVHLTQNDGTTWSPIPLDTPNTKEIKISLFDNKVIAFTSTGVYSLDTNTFTWTKFGNNLMGLDVKDLVKTNNKFYASSYFYGVTETNLNGEYKNILPKHNAINIFSKENTVYVRTNLGIFKKHIHDSTWQNVHPILDNKNFLGLLLEGDTLYCLTANEIWAKPIKDTGCLKLGDGISDNAVNRLFIFNNSMYTFSAYGAYKFNKTTLKWDKAEYNLVNAAFNEACVYNAKLTVATSEGIFQLNEIGDEWVLIPNTEKYGEIKAMDTNGEILAFYSQSLPGVYYCADSNYNFYPFSHQLPTMDVKKMKIYEDTLYAGGTKGIWFRPLNELSSSIQSKVRNESVVAIYPNPFSESINLSMKNPSFVASSVTLKDMLGRTIKQELITNNPYKLSLQEIPSGLYLITIANDKFNVTYKVIKQ